MWLAVAVSQNSEPYNVLDKMNARSNCLRVAVSVTLDQMKARSNYLRVTVSVLHAYYHF